MPLSSILKNVGKQLLDFWQELWNILSTVEENFYCNYFGNNQLHMPGNKFVFY